MRSLIWISLILGYAYGAMMAVDFGSQFFKVAVIKPGSGLEIAFNEQSKRKTPSAIAFTDEGERLFGDAAVTYSTKHPQRAILNTRDLLGVFEKLEDESAPVKWGRKNGTIVIGEEETNYPAEALAAMILGQAKKFASGSLDQTSSMDFVRDVVITIPSWFGEAERGAVVDATKLANLNAPMLIKTNSATALKILFDAKETKLNQTILIYDVGASSVSVSVLRISKSQSSSGKEDTLIVDALAHAWDKELSGVALDELLANYVAEKFDETLKEEETVKTIPRVMSRLRKEVQRLREVLSANTEAIFSVGSLHADQDFRLKILRSEFEELAADLFDRVMIPVKKCLEEANVSPSELDAVIPYGGVSRIPIIQARLMEGLQRDTLNKSVNSDEAAVFGALWYGASVNSLVKQRKVEVIEHFPYEVKVAVGRDNSSAKVEPQMTSIFDAGSKIPQRKTINFKRRGQFNITVSNDGQDPAIAAYTISNVEDVITKMENSTNAPNPKVSLSFNIDKAGLIEIYKAEATIEETILVEKIVSKNVTESESESVSASASEESSEGSEKKDPEEESKEPADASPSASESPVEKQYSSQMTVHRVSLTKQVMRNVKSFAGRRMSPADVGGARAILSKLDDNDKKRKERADNLNSLESSIFQLREKLWDEDLESVSTEEERDSIRTALEEAEDWTFTADKATAREFSNKEKELRKLVDKLVLRHTEQTERPKAVEELQKALEIAKSSCTLTKQLHEEKNSPELPKIEAFEKEIESAAEYLDKCLKDQEGKTVYDDPAFESADVRTRAQAITKGMGKLMKLRLPKDPTPTPEAKPSEEEKKEETDSKEGEKDDSTEEEKEEL